MNITIKFNGDMVTRTYEAENVTTSEILRDTKISNFLGFDSQRVVCYLEGMEYTGLLQDGDSIDIVTKSSTKGTSEFFYQCAHEASELSEIDGRSFFFHYFRLIENSI
jgi:hypothetical protein